MPRADNSTVSRRLGSGGFLCRHGERHTAFQFAGQGSAQIGGLLHIDDAGLLRAGVRECGYVRGGRGTRTLLFGLVTPERANEGFAVVDLVVLEVGEDNKVAA